MALANAPPSLARREISGVSGDRASPTDRHFTFSKSNATWQLALPLAIENARKLILNSFLTFELDRRLSSPCSLTTHVRALCSLASVPLLIPRTPRTPESQKAHSCELCLGLLYCAQYAHRHQQHEQHSDKTCWTRFHASSSTLSVLRCEQCRLSFTLSRERTHHVL